MAKKEINQVRVIIPNNPKEKLDLAARVFSKHSSLGPTSPLSPLDWSVHGPNINNALVLNDKAEDLKRQMEQAYEQRDLLLEPIDDLLKQSRDMLKSVYRKEPRKIGEFGYTVNSSARAGNDLASTVK